MMYHSHTHQPVIDPNAHVALGSKQFYALGVLFALLAASFCTSFTCYKATEQLISNDMNQALAQAMAEQRCDIISEDTIRTFNSHLQLEELRGKAVLAVDTRQHQFTCYARCSAATIFSLSDQRPASVLWAASLLWAVCCLYGCKRGQLRPCPQPAEATATTVAFGGLTYSADEGRFYTTAGQAIRLTPMQQQLMELFLAAPAHRLSKSAICDALWPKKPDASDTLYTLIRRLRPIIEQHTLLRIESDRGQAYRLTDSALQ